MRYFHLCEKMKPVNTNILFFLHWPRSEKKKCCFATEGERPRPPATRLQEWPQPPASLPWFPLLGSSEAAGSAVTKRRMPGQKTWLPLGLSPAVPLQVPGPPAPASVALRITALPPLLCLNEGPQGAGSVPLEGVRGAKPSPGSGLQGNGASRWAWGGKAVPAPPGAAPAETGLPESHSTSLLGGPLGTQARGVCHPRAQLRTEQHVRGWRAEISGVRR